MRQKYYLILLSILFSCTTKESKNIDNECIAEPNISAIQIKTAFVRIDKAIVNAKDSTEIQKILAENPLYEGLYLAGEPAEAPRVANFSQKVLWDMAKEPYMDTLQQDCEKIVDINKLEKELTLVFKRIKAYYPDFVPPKVYFSISGIGSFPLNGSTDIFLSKNGEILVIGLDWFLGTNYRFKLPETVPIYLARRYEAKNIPVFVATLLSSRYNLYNPTQNSLLNDMLFYAKAYYFTQSVIPCLPDSLVLGYTPTQMTYIEQNKEQIWKHYLDKKIFFETSSRIKRDYVEESPFTLPISQDCPGGIARWTGLRMLKKYVAKKKIDLPKVMKLEDAQGVLSESGYKGE
ncbi:MAG: hypothetical protein SFU27_09840 [Thermonemataceae bacterium]|nr:hypothetical protein [Thermonemataceae bacterium]